jgi:hypothetical protein
VRGTGFDENSAGRHGAREDTARKRLTAEPSARVAIAWQARNDFTGGLNAISATAFTTSQVALSA